MTATTALTTPREQPARATTAWTIDPTHSRAEFTVRHLMISNVRGTIPVLKATLVRDENDITQSRIEAELDVTGITTGAADRDAHLRSADFFDVANHPTMRFASTRVEEVEDGLRIHGDLTIRDVTRPVVLDVELTGEGKDPWGGTRGGATATTSFDRRDFGLTWNAAIEAGGGDGISRREGEPQLVRILVGDKVKVHLDLQAIKQ